MPKDLTKPADSHARLINDALPLACDVFVETMGLSSWDEVEKTDPETGETTVTRTFNARINSQKIRAGGMVLSAAVHLGDQALKRQAGGQLRELIKRIKAMDPTALQRKPQVIEQAAEPDE